MNKRQNAKHHTQRIARCSMTTALGVVVMLTLGWTGVATYAAPMLAMLLGVLIQRQYGAMSALLVWLSTGVLSLLLVADKEQAVVYLFVFGWYPAVKPLLDALPRGLRVLCKAAVFNLSIVVGYAFLFFVLGVAEGIVWNLFTVVMLLMGNALFALADIGMIPLLVPRLERLLKLNV